MAADAEFVEHVMELLAPFGEVRSRAMFGGYGIFHEDAMFALISSSAFYFKVGDGNRADFERAGSEQFKPMPYYSVPADVMEDGDAFGEWAVNAISIGHATAAKKRPRKKRG